MTTYRTITCPQCRFAKTVPADTIPAAVTSVTCPQCGTSFALEEPALPPAPPPSPSLPADHGHKEGRHTLNFHFSGAAREYFGIWIVNTVLKIVTFGIYSAWAKVRKRRWFYGNTWLDGHAFEYLADPKALFKGWLIGVGALMLYSAAGKIDPLLAIPAGLALFLAIPWVIVRSRMFNNRNSSHRNIRFGFRANYREAYTVYAWLPLLSLLSLGLLYPYTVYRQRKFHVEQSSFGSAPLRFDAKARDYYRVYAGASLWFVLILGIIGVAATLLLQGAPGLKNPRDLHLLLGPMLVLLYIGMLMLSVVFTVYLKVRLANLTWNGTCLGSGRFASSLRIQDLLWLYISNLVAIALTLGLMIPWAAVRLARYRCAHLVFIHEGPLDNFLADAQGKKVGAAGEELADLFDVGVEIGL